MYMYMYTLMNRDRARYDPQKTWTQKEEADTLEETCVAAA